MADRQYNRGAYHGTSSPQRSTPPPRSNRPADEEGEVLATLPRGDSDELRLLIREYEGRPFLALQVYSTDDRGELVAVRGKMATIRVREVPEMIQALKRAEARFNGGGNHAGATSGRPGPQSKAPAQPAPPSTEWVQPTDDEETPF